MKKNEYEAKKVFWNWKSFMISPIFQTLQRNFSKLYKLFGLTVWNCINCINSSVFVLKKFKILHVPATEEIWTVK